MSSRRTSEGTPLVKEDHESRHDAPGKSKYLLVTLGSAALATVGGLFVYFATHPSSSFSVTTAPSYCDPSVKHEFGYIQLPHKVNDHYFYSFFESRHNPATDPLVVWLEGGPGSSSTWAMFNVNGPCFIGDNLNSTAKNPFSWTEHSNMLWLDQPTNVGFSVGDAADDDRDEADVGRNFYAFMQSWLKQHPQYQARPLYIAGQSYGGHYVPAAAQYIVREQAKAALAPDAIHINLQGISIGNGFTNPVIQAPMVVDMVDAIAHEYNITLASPATVAQLRHDAAVVGHLLQACQSANETHACLEALTMWSDKILTPLVTNPTRNPYDVRDICDPTCNDYGMAKTGVYLNQPHVQAMLGVHKPYAWNNATVGMAFAVDAGKSVALLVPEILAAGVRVLLNVGDADLMCDWQGNDAWAKQLEWPGKSAYNAATVTPLVVDGKTAGQVRSAQGLTFVRVYNSGHGVPVDQPLVGLTLLHRFLQNASLHE
ncbi:Aste57867_10946 [Aphanomyces stellatus]|uniref:Aste57867_10946 protein n=1 Tax=Aphanomyces stellatus TaxID=120398 RepID=A0A485KRM1_9STRA|nr:hypothetical protein As57867_010906 [Aphanomyces stellatus]VFT87814.1 Aste57867_10946 [Aphanomyces stellatus]